MNGDRVDILISFRNMSQQGYTLIPSGGRGNLNDPHDPENRPWRPPVYLPGRNESDSPQVTSEDGQRLIWPRKRWIRFSWKGFSNGIELILDRCCVKIQSGNSLSGWFDPMMVQTYHLGNLNIVTLDSATKTPSRLRLSIPHSIQRLWRSTFLAPQVFFRDFQMRIDVVRELGRITESIRTIQKEQSVDYLFIPDIWLIILSFFW